MFELMDVRWINEACGGQRRLKDALVDRILEFRRLRPLSDVSRCTPEQSWKYRKPNQPNKEIERVYLVFSER
jgi:hypothetical protein